MPALIRKGGIELGVGDVELRGQHRRLVHMPALGQPIDRMYNRFAVGSGKDHRGGPLSQIPIRTSSAGTASGARA